MSDDPKWGPWRILQWGETAVDPRLAEARRQPPESDYDRAMADLGEARVAFRKEYDRRNRRLIWQLATVVALALIALVVGAFAQ